MRTFEIPSTILDTETDGSSVNLGALSDTGATVCAIFVSAAYDQTAIEFDASLDGGTTWSPVQKVDGSALSYTCTASTAQAISVPAQDLSGFKMIRPRAPGAVGADAVLTFVARPV